jgi:hypothetical protein
MPATLHGFHPLSSRLSPLAQSAFVLDNLKPGTLVPLAQLCDDDCIAVFTKNDVQIVKRTLSLLLAAACPMVSGLFLSTLLLLLFIKPTAFYA